MIDRIIRRIARWLVRGLYQHGLAQARDCFMQFPPTPERSVLLAEVRMAEIEYESWGCE